jgi:hypothetical protein
MTPIVHGRGMVWYGIMPRRKRRLFGWKITFHFRLAQKITRLGRIGVAIRVRVSSAVFYM